MHGERAPSSAVVSLLGGLSVTCGGARLAVPPGSRRLLAYLALHPAGVDRRSTAGILWPAVGDGRAAGNLRSALWRLQRGSCPLVVAEPSVLRLTDGVEVDLRLLEAWASRVLAVRQRLQLRLLHALEALSRLLQQAGRPDAAVEAMHVAVRAEPLRESGQRALIEAHQAAGDWVAARRQYDAFRSILRREIGVEPSAELTAVARGPART